MKKVVPALALLAVAFAAGCGGGEEGSESPPSAAVAAVCNGSPLTEDVMLPADFPEVDSENLVYTKQESAGPTEVVEGYFMGSVEQAHDEFKAELENAGFDITFDEVEENDSEVAWRGDGRTGIVAIRNDCGDPDKLYIRITNRPE